MHLLRFHYYLASEGCPDAMPAGIIAVDLGFNFDDLDADEDGDIEDVVLCCSERGFFDDSELQLGIEGGDGITHKVVGPHHAVCLSNDLVVPTFMWEALKTTPGFVYSEHSIEADDRANEIFLEEYKKQNPEEFEEDEA